MKGAGWVLVAVLLWGGCRDQDVSEPEPSVTETDALCDALASARGQSLAFAFNAPGETLTDDELEAEIGEQKARADFLHNLRDLVPPSIAVDIDIVAASVGKDLSEEPHQVRDAVGRVGTYFRESCAPLLDAS